MTDEEIKNQYHFYLKQIKALRKIEKDINEHMQILQKQCDHQWKEDEDKMGIRCVICGLGSPYDMFA